MRQNTPLSSDSWSLTTFWAAPFTVRQTLLVFMFSFFSEACVRSLQSCHAQLGTASGWTGNKVSNNFNYLQEEDQSFLFKCTCLIVSSQRCRQPEQQRAGKKFLTQRFHAPLFHWLHLAVCQFFLSGFCQQWFISQTSQVRWNYYKMTCGKGVHSTGEGKSLRLNLTIHLVDAFVYVLLCLTLYT